MIHKFLKSFLHLLRRTKRGTRSVGFFAKGPPRGSGWTRIFLKMFHFFLKISQNVPFFSQNLHVAKERANTKVKGGMPKKMNFSQNFSKCSTFFSKCHFFSQNVPFVPKMFPIIFSKSSHCFLKFFHCFLKFFHFFLKFFNFFLKMFQLFLKTFSFQIHTKKNQNILG